MKALVIRGVYVRGVPHSEGAIVEVSPQEFAELKTANYIVEAPATPPAKVEKKGKE